MVQVNMAPDYVEVLNRIFQPIGRILRQDGNIPVFFLTLKSRSWVIRYYGVVPEKRPEVATNGTILKEIRNKEAQWLDDIVKSFQENVDEWGYTNLDELVLRISDKMEGKQIAPPALNNTLDKIQEVAQEQRITFSELLNRAAVGFLSGVEIELGSVIDDENKAHWSWRTEPISAVKWFQDALDYACFYNSESERFIAGDEIKREQHFFTASLDDHYENRTIRKDLIFGVRKYMRQRVGLVDRSTFTTFLAEYLYSQQGVPKKENPPSALNHFFLLLRGLGQWRAAACWLGAEEEAPSHISGTLNAAFRDLYSKSLVDYVGMELHRALTSPAMSAQSVCEAFAILWWAYEVTFYRAGRCVRRMVRDSQGNLEFTSEVASENPLKGTSFITVSKEQYPKRWVIQLNLSNIENLEISNILEFDTICYKADMIKELSEGMTEVINYEQSLKERLSELLSLHHAQLQKQLAAGAYMIGHPLKDRVGAARISFKTLRINFDEHIKSTLDTEIYDELDFALQSLKHAFKRIENLGHLLDIISAAVKLKKGADTFLGKERWYEQEPYELADKLVEISQYTREYDAYQIVLDEASLKIFSDKYIDTWVQNGSKRVRPSDLIYTELFDEALTNAALHGQPREADGKVMVYLEEEIIPNTDQNIPCIVFRNQCRKADEAKRLQLRPGEWHKWNNHVTGSLSFIDTFLRSTECGQLFVRVNQQDGKFYFSSGLFLNGLRNA